MAKNHKIYLSSCGVRVEIKSCEKRILSEITKNINQILPINNKISTLNSDNSKKTNTINIDVDDTFLELGIDQKSDNSRKYKITVNEIVESQNLPYEDVFKTVESKIRLIIAEYASKLVFLHAGVVEFEGRAIIIPGRSYSGKTSLVVELIKNGCQYLSDEYAIINRQGVVKSFPKHLSVRGIINDYTQQEIPVSEFGGRIYRKPLKPGWILISKYQKSKRTFDIKKVTAGEGLLACLDNSVSIRRQPEFVLSVLGNVIKECDVLKTERGEATKFVPKFLDFLRKDIKSL